MVTFTDAMGCNELNEFQKLSAKQELGNDSQKKS